MDVPPMSSTPLCMVSRSRERREAVRQPRVDGHVGHDARAVDEAGLRGDEEQARLAEEGHDHEPVARVPAAQAPGRRRPCRAGRRSSSWSSRRVGRDVDEQVAEEDAARGDGQRRRHQHHGALGGLHARLAHDLHAVARRPRCPCTCRRRASRRARRAPAPLNAPRDFTVACRFAVVSAETAPMSPTCPPMATTSSTRA